MNKQLLFSLFLCIVSGGFAQQDFNSIYQNLDPATDSSFSHETKIKLHQEFLASAHTRQDTFEVILGNLFLSDDYAINTDYPSAISHLIEAGNLASAIEDTLLLGRVNHKKGAVYSWLQNNQEAIEYYQTALGLSEIAKDSYYMAISLEQLGRMHSKLKEFDKSNEYFRKAIPMIEEFGRPQSLTTTLINYGNSLDEQDSVAKAIQVYKRAIRIGEEIQDDYETIPAKQNLALVYVVNDSLDKALELYHVCKQANEKNGWLNFLIYSYDGLGFTHEKMGNLDSAIFYYQKYYSLKDSITGVQIQSRINQLETTNEIQKKDIDLLQEKERTYRQKQYAKNIIIAAFFLLGSSAWGLWLLYQKGRRTKLRLEENRLSLHQLARLLESKNAELRELKSQSIKNKSVDQSGEDELHKKINFYDLSILTDADWHTFKTLFEKAYPNYLLKIRRTFPDISEAEERMFIFIKLQLSNKESANIVGVQPDTIKKTRSRLRKRLGLDKTDNLNEFVLNFG